MAFETLIGFLLQSNISAGNVKTMNSMSDIEDDRFRSFLDLVQEIARLRPHKRRRWKWLSKNHPELLARICQNEHFEWMLDLAHEEGGWEPDDSDHINDLLAEQYDGEEGSFEAW